MPVPKRKRSRARRDSRFANKGIKAKPFNSCANCEHPMMSHQVCHECGYYKGRKIMETKNDRAAKRGKVRAAVAARQQKMAEKQSASTELSSAEQQ